MKTLFSVMFCVCLSSPLMAAVDITDVISNYQTDAANWTKVLASKTFSNGNKLRYSLTKISNYRRDILNYRSVIDNSFLIDSKELNHALDQIEIDVKAQRFNQAITKINNLKNF